MKERTKRLCDSIIALSLAVSVLSSAAAIKTYSARLEAVRPSVTAFAASYETAEQIPGYMSNYYQDETTGESVAGVIVGVTIPENQSFDCSVTQNGYTIEQILESGFSLTLDKFTDKYAKSLAEIELTEEGKTFKGWATTEGATVAISSLTNEDFNEDPFINLYPVWETSEQPSDTPDDTEEEPTDAAEQGTLNDAAKTLLDEVQAIIDQCNEDLKKKTDLTKDYFTENTTACDGKIAQAKAKIEEANGGINSTLAKQALDNVETNYKALKKEINKLPSSKDVQQVKDVDAINKEIKGLAEAAETAAKNAKESQDWDEYWNYLHQIDDKKAAREEKLSAADDRVYVEEQTAKTANEADSAYTKAQKVFDANAFAAKDKDGEWHTFDQLRCNVTELASNHDAVVQALAKITGVESDKKFAQGWKATWTTTSGKEIVEVKICDSVTVTVRAQEALKDYKVYSYKASDSSLNSAPFNLSYANGAYTLDYAVYEPSMVFVVAGNYYPAVEDEKDEIVADNPDSNKGTTRDELEKDFANGTKTYYEVTPIAEGSGVYSSIEKKLAGKGDILAAYDISLKDNLAVLPKKSVKVTLTDTALKGKTFDIYHMVGSSMNPVKLATVTADKDGKFSFTTDSFSPFVMTTPTSSSSSSSGDSSSTGTGLTSPRTGEGSPLPFVLAAVGALGVAGGVVVWRKKKTAED